MLLKQKAACRWLEEGEKNTKYFHSLVKKRKRKSRIYEIQHNGETLTEPEEIKASVVEHFEQAFSNDGNVILQNIHWVPSVLTQEDVQQLQENPTRENVKAVVFDMCADSTAGSTPPKNFTTTTIVLIPKTETHQLGKTFVQSAFAMFQNQTHQHSNDPLHLTQSGFVQGRLISDNILLSRTHCLGKNGCMNNTIFKLDMEKAYDRVNWNFLYLMLCKVGFPTVWIDMIKKLIENCCLASSSMVKVWGSLSRRVDLGRVILSRQPSLLLRQNAFHEDLNSCISSSPGLRSSQRVICPSPT
ncbi:UNVERIFIED_CONTAM: hypothetical protein Sradi_5523600 [Sesamum radiatum]|uniref:Reverse transcriptase domain-containing protein n=1 Tax=Sesamum radiatum TaxID=300843 RepID=A0AAW2LBH7_SESRA